MTSWVPLLAWAPWLGAWPPLTPLPPAPGACVPGLALALIPRILPQVETISDSDTENRSRREFHSIGVQVEDDKR